MKKLTKKEIADGYIWKCPVCLNVSKYDECICERCYGEDA